jgi:hypothetical protein
VMEFREVLDRDLAELYGVQTKVLKQVVRRNIGRFPPDFMFEINKKEFVDLRSQIVTSSWGGPRYMPMAFTEQGVAMLPSVLKSDCAIRVNIQVMRVFTQLHRMSESQKGLKRKIEAMEKNYDEQFRTVFEAITQLIEEDEKPKKKIGYIKEGQTKYGQRDHKNLTGIKGCLACRDDFSRQNHDETGR